MPSPIAYAPPCHLHCLLGFNGERPDPVTGHYLLGNGYRAYNPVLLRFNSPDSWSPFGKGGLNPYGYCAGDPVNRRDPTGHALWTDLLALGLSSASLVAAGANFLPSPGFLEALRPVRAGKVTVSAVARLIATPSAFIGAALSVTTIAVRIADPESPHLKGLAIAGALFSGVAISASITAIATYSLHKRQLAQWASRSPSVDLPMAQLRTPSPERQPANANRIRRNTF